MSYQRLLSLIAMLLCAFALVLGMLFLCAENQSYAQAAQEQRITTLALPQRRGNFYDRTGQKLTGVELVYSTLCIPGEQSYKTLYRYADASAQAVLYARRNQKSPFLVTTQQDMSASGLMSIPAEIRYQTRQPAASLLGYLSGEGKGVSGLEYVLDKTLAGSGEKAYVQCVTTASGALFENSSPQYEPPAFDGKGVQLTLRLPLQLACETIAETWMEKGAIVVLETKTAEVLACVSFPCYDPNNIADSLNSDKGAFINRCLASYSVGSVFKPVVAAAALESGLDQYKIDCIGYVRVAEQTYRCAGWRAHGIAGIQLALQESCNCFFISLGQQLGAQRLLEYAQRFGFGQEIPVYDTDTTTGSNLPTAEELKNLGQLANFSFGQGLLLASPVQVAAMMNVFACGGVYTQPTFVKAFLNEDTGETEPVEQLVRKERIVQQQTAEQVLAMLSTVVTEGTGQEAMPFQHMAAGKTGTAQTGSLNAEGEELLNFWFAGVYPLENPQYTIVVMQDGLLEPQNSSAAIFAEICRQIWLLEG